MFSQLLEAPAEESTPFFDQIRAAYVQDPFEFAWNTDVPDVTDPWPTIEDPVPLTIRDAIRILSRREDVTAFLYTLKELDEYAGNYTAQPCERCAVPGCADKWCGLRGDDDVRPE